MRYFIQRREIYSVLNDIEIIFESSAYIYEKKCAIFETSSIPLGTAGTPACKLIVEVGNKTRIESHLGNCKEAGFVRSCKLQMHFSDIRTVNTGSMYRKCYVSLSFLLHFLIYFLLFFFFFFILFRYLYIPIVNSFSMIIFYDF